MEYNMLTSLINEFKGRLRITWSDETETELIKGYIQSGDRYLSDIAMGARIDYNSDLYARELLYNYVLYVRSDSLAEFGKAYNSELLNLRITYRRSLADEENKE